MALEKLSNGTWVLIPDKKRRGISRSFDPLLNALIVILWSALWMLCTLGFLMWRNSV